MGQRLFVTTMRTFRTPSFETISTVTLLAPTTICESLSLPASLSQLLEAVSEELCSLFSVSSDSVRWVRGGTSLPVRVATKVGVYSPIQKSPFRQTLFKNGGGGSGLGAT
jgi:hypothetical protein